MEIFEKHRPSSPWRDGQEGTRDREFTIRRGKRTRTRAIGDPVKFESCAAILIGGRDRGRVERRTMAVVTWRVCSIDVHRQKPFERLKAETRRKGGKWLTFWAGPLERTAEV